MKYNRRLKAKYKALVEQYHHKAPLDQELLDRLAIALSQAEARSLRDPRLQLTADAAIAKAGRVSPALAAEVLAETIQFLERFVTLSDIEIANLPFNGGGFVLVPRLPWAK